MNIVKHFTSSDTYVTLGVIRQPPQQSSPPPPMLRGLDKTLAMWGELNELNPRSQNAAKAKSGTASECLTIISCKYENSQRLQFTTEFAKTYNKDNNTKPISTAILPSLCRHCQSKATHCRIWAQAMLFAHQTS